MKMANRLFIILTVFLIVISSGYLQAHAEEQSYSEREKVGFAFYNLTNLKPQFGEWVKNTRKYKDAPEEQRDYFLQQDTLRLEQAFAGYDVKKDLIRIYLPARVYIPDSAERKSLDAENKDIPVEIAIRNFEDGFFPYLIGGNWIALIPLNFGDLATFEMNKNDYAVFADNLGIDAHAKRWDAKIEMLLLPSKADLNTPLKRKGQALWPLSAHVAYIGIHQAFNDEFAWKIYQADWYHSPRDTSLLKLYRP